MLFVMDTWKRNLYIIWLAQIFSIAGFQFGIPFIPFFLQELGISGDEQIKFWTGITAAGPSLGLAIMAPVWGYLADRFSKKAMMVRAMFSAAVILSLMGLSVNAYMLASLRVLQGFLTGTVSAALAMVAAMTPREKQAYALGFISSATFIGNTLGQAAGGFTAGYFGYRFSFLIGGLIIFSGFCLMLLAVKEKKTLPALIPQNILKEAVKIVRQPLFLILILFLFLIRMVRMTLPPYLPLLVQDMIGGVRGAPQATGIILAVTSIAVALSGLTIVRLADRLNKWTLLFLMLGTGFLGSFFLIPVNNIFSFSIVFIIISFFIGGIEPVINSSISTSSPAALRGTIFGLTGQFGSLGWFFAPLAGSFVSINFGCRYLFYFFSILLFISLVFLFIFKKTIKAPACFYGHN